MKKEKILEKKIYEYTEGELNGLDYELALKSDKRNYFDYYISLIKTKHDLIYTFCYNKDYNMQIIKIDIFFISFTIEYTINSLFFDDDTMHKIYETKGSFNFLYQLPSIIYSTLISIALNSILKLLAFSNDAILDFKQEKSIDNLEFKEKKLRKKLQIKFILYFILSFLFLLFFWYYLAMFGAIYRNTQIHLLNDTLISLGISFIFPFIFNLIPGLLRIPALSDAKHNRKYLYKFSKFLQAF